MADSMTVEEHLRFIDEMDGRLRDLLEHVDTLFNVIHMVDESAQGNPPRCTVHNAPMWKQRGLFRSDWYCQAKNPDGTPCSVRAQQV